MQTTKSLLLGWDCGPVAVNDVVQADGGFPFPDYVQHDIYDTPAGAAKIRSFLMNFNHCTY